MRSVILSACVLFASGSALAEPLARVEGVEAGELMTALESAVGERANATSGRSSAIRRARTAAERARRLLRSRGYYAATVTPDVGAAREPVIRIETGPQFLVASLTASTQGDDAARETALGRIALPEGAPLLAQSVIDAEARGLHALQEAGWPDASVAEREVVVDHATHAGRINFRYQPGPYSLYGDIDTETAPWNAQFIARMAPFNAGDPAKREEILTYQRRLDALDSVQSSRVVLGEVGEDGRRPVGIELTAAPRHSLEAGLNYSTSEGAGGSSRWSRRNVFGSDETLTLTGVLATLNQSLTAEITRPHWRRYKQTLFINAGLTREDTDAYSQDEAGLGAEITREDGRRLYGAGVHLDWSRVTDTLGQRDVVTAKLDLVAGYDSRNDPLDPDRGVRGTLQASPAVTLGDCSCQYIQLDARGSAYQRLGENLVAAARLRVGSVIGASAINMPADQRFYAGGGGSARGFSYQSLSPLASDGTPFGGSSVVETSLELRWRVRPRWGVVGFVDAAMASDTNQPDFSGMRASAGIGARYYFDFAPVRVDIATPLDRRDGEDAFQIYFSLGQAF